MRRAFAFLFFTALLLPGCDKARVDTDEEIKGVNVRVVLDRGWMLQKVGDTEPVPAVVPGVVQETLINTGGAQDPFYRTQEKDIQWIGEEDWEYQLTTAVPEELFTMEEIDLVFEGLDTYADVYLNDSLILQSDNMFITYQVDVKSLLRSSGNELRIVFHSPLKIHKERWANKPYELPADNDAGEEKVSVYTRKAPFHFGWDWAPRMLTQGIWRPVYFEGHSSSYIKNVKVTTKEINKDKALMELEANVFSGKEQERRVDLFLGVKKKSLMHENVQLKKGDNPVKMSFEIDNPGLWWPNGYGEQKLYELHVQLRDQKHKLISTKPVRFGVRTIELVNEDDEIGRSFFFKVNGAPIFIKGANYIPQDVLLTRVTPEDYKVLIADAISANMNMLRVWGGGVYESDLFYDLCDENGILVWQDFMFACSMYPFDADFKTSVQEEVYNNVSRLQNHPSIALWCGNNEIDVAWHNWGWQTQYNYSAEDSAEIWDNYRHFFHKQLINMVEHCDGSRPYVTTSPLSNWGTPENFNFSSMHYWGVWHGKEPFENYRTNVGRFMSEYGFQSFPEMKTIRTFAAEEDMDLNSDVMKHHQKSYIGNDMLMEHLTTYYPRPQSFEHFTYLTQLSQAYGMEMAITSHRTSKGHCMGTLYWQLNDCWPGPSWSSIDYEGRWKALHYRVRELYDPLAIMIKVEERDSLGFYAVSDGRNIFHGQMQFTMLNFDGDTVKTMVGRAIMISGDTLAQGGIYHLQQIWDQHFSADQHVLVVALKDRDDNEVRSKIVLGVNPAELKLKDPKITYAVKQEEGGYAIVFSCESFAKDVFVQSDGYQGKWSDNYFDLIPGKTKTVFYKSDTLDDEKFNALKPRLKVISLYDTL